MDEVQIETLLLRGYSNAELANAVRRWVAGDLASMLPSPLIPPQEYVAAVVAAAKRLGRLDQLVAGARAERPHRVGDRSASLSPDLLPVPTPLAHRLHRYARGPRVQARYVSLELVEAFAGQYDDAGRAMLAIRRAATIRLEADSDATVVDAGWLPDFGTVGANTYWSRALDHARLHGPRMMAAMLELLEVSLLSAAERASVMTLTAALPLAERADD